MDDLATLNGLYQNSDGSNRFKTYDVGTPDPTKYHDPSAVSLIGSGRSLSSVLPGSSFGLKGIIIPRATEDGGSMGFDPHKPQKCFIDPGMTNTPIVVDYAKLNKHSINSAVADAAAAGASNLQDRGLLAYLKMAHMSQHSAPTPSVPVTSSGLISRPLGNFVAAQQHVPMGGPPPGIPSAPRLAPPEAHSAGPFTNGSIRDAFSPRPAPPPVTAQGPAHRYRVDFELPRPMGTFTGYYHEVIRKDELLILVYDHNLEPTSQLWFPTAPDSPEEAYEIPLLVYDEYGVPDTAFMVQPTPARFSRRGVEFSILAVSKEKCLKEDDNGH